jgi:hypothetical protein
MKRQRRGPKWSAEVTETSDALDLEKDVSKSRSAKRIAESLKRSAEQSHRRKASPFHSAMSMLTFVSTGLVRTFRRRKTHIGNRQDRAAPPVRPCALGLAAPGKQTASARG